MPSRTYIDREFKGVNTYIAPAELGPGLLTQCDNLRVDGGDLVTRPGLQGLLAAPHTMLVNGSPVPAPIYGMTAHVLPDGTTELVYAAGSKLFRFLPTNNDDTEILLGGSSFAFANYGAGVMLERAGKYLYGVDGAGALFRVDDSGNGSSVVGLTAPAIAPGAALTDRVIDAFSSTASGWQNTWTYSQLPLPTGQKQPTNVLTDGNFGKDFNGNNNGDGSPINGITNFWKGFRTSAGSPALTKFEPVDNDNFIQMDDTPSAFKMTAAKDNLQLYEAGSSTSPYATNPPRFATQFAFNCQYDASYYTDGGIFTLAVYGAVATDAAVAADTGTGNGTPLATRTLTFQAAGTSAVLSWSGIFDFSGLDTPILSYRLYVYAGAGNRPIQTGGQNGPYFGRLVLAPFDYQVTFTGSNGYVGINVPINGGSASSGTANIGDLRLVKELGTPTDLSHESHIEIGLNQLATFTGMEGQLGFRTAGLSGTTVLSNPFTVQPGDTFITVDISTIDPTKLTAVEFVEIRFTGDLIVTNTSGGVLFALGPFASAGNLTVGYADYQYLYTEVQDALPTTAAINADTLFANVLESNPSPVSVSLTPTSTLAQALLTLPAKQNAAATHFRIYRFGGTVGFSQGGSDGLYRLIGTWQFGTGGAPKDGATTLASYSTATTATLPNGTVSTPNGFVVDNVPDDSLLAQTTVADFGRDAAPEKAQAICFYQGRLGLAVGSQFYWSWLVDSEGAAGLYFNTFLDPNDPSAAVKGGLYPIGGDDNDPITRFDPFASQLVIWKGRSAWVAVGSDAQDLRVQQFLSAQGIGCVAPRGGGKVGNHIWVRGADSLYQFDADTVDDVGVPVEKSLTASAKNDAFLYAQRRAYWIGQAAGAAANANNSIAWVWDTRTASWSRYTGFLFTGGVTLAGGTSTDSAYFGGYDGQIYTFADTLDRGTPAGGASAFSWTARTRAFGADTGREMTATHALCELDVAEPTAVTLTVQEDGGRRSASATFACTTTGQKRLRLRLPPGKARGRALTVRVSGSSSAALRIQAIGLEAVTGARESN